jgi:hypothetical protein
MAQKPEMPHTQTSAPVKPPSTTEDVPARRSQPDEDRPARREAGGEAVKGDEMPEGADEPGAGL